MPVTFFIFTVLLVWFVVIVLRAKPRQNEAVIAKISITGCFFILYEFAMEMTHYINAMKLHSTTSLYKLHLVFDKPKHA